MKTETADVKIDWKAAEERLLHCAKVYASIGRSGEFVILHVILPLWWRLNRGERTQELYDAIMAIAL